MLIDLKFENTIPLKNISSKHAGMRDVIISIENAGISFIDWRRSEALFGKKKEDKAETDIMAGCIITDIRTIRNIFIVSKFLSAKVSFKLVLDGLAKKKYIIEGGRNIASSITAFCRIKFSGSRLKTGYTYKSENRMFITNNKAAKFPAKTDFFIFYSPKYNKLLLFSIP